MSAPAICYCGHTRAVHDDRRACTEYGWDGEECGCEAFSRAKPFTAEQIAEAERQAKALRATLNIEPERKP